MAHRAGGAFRGAQSWDEGGNGQDGVVAAQDLLVDLNNGFGNHGAGTTDGDDDDDDDDVHHEGNERQPLLAPSTLSTASSHHTSEPSGDYALAELHPSLHGGSCASSASTRSLFEDPSAPMQAQTSLSTHPSSSSPTHTHASTANHTRRKQRHQSLQPQRQQRQWRSSRLAHSQDLASLRSQRHGEQRGQRPRAQTLQRDPEKEQAVVISLERLESEMVHLRTLCAPAPLQPHEPCSESKRRNRRRRWLSKRVTHRLLLMTIIWQVLNVGILTLLDRRIPQEKIQDHFLADPAVLAGVIIMVVFQTIHMIVIVISSIKLAKQILHRTASNSFLVQSYLSTIVLYAGVYTLLFRIDKNTFQGVEESLETVSSKGFIFLCFMKFLYFSVTTMTSTGFGDITPKTWYMDAIVSSQMLISIVYTTSIFAKGLTIIAGSRAHSALGGTEDDEESAKGDEETHPTAPNATAHTSGSQRQTRAINSSISSA